MNSIELSNLEENGFTFYYVQQILYRLFRDRVGAFTGKPQKSIYQTRNKPFPEKKLFLKRSIPALLTSLQKSNEKQGYSIEGLYTL